MAHGQFAAHHRDDVPQVSAVAHIGKERTIFLIDCLPIVSVHFGVIKILALDAPRLTVDLFPFGAGFNPHLQLGHVERSIAYLNRNRAIGGYNSPTGPSAGAGLIQKFLLVVRERVRANAFQERRGCALFELISLQAERCRRGRSRQNWFGVIETSGRARREVAVITCRDVYGDYSLPYSFKVDANIHGSRRGWRRLSRRLGAFFAGRGSWRFIASFRQEG